jgi:hypothetical protein
VAQVRTPAGVAVPQRLVEGRHIHVRRDIFAEHALPGAPELDALAAERPGGTQNNL